MKSFSVWTFASGFFHLSLMLLRFTHVVICINITFFYFAASILALYWINDLIVEEKLKSSNMYI